MPSRDALSAMRWDGAFIRALPWPLCGRPSPPALPPFDCIRHSNRGLQYAAETYHAELEAHGLRGSMGRRGNPYDNAKAESFMKTLKVEEAYLDGVRDLR